MYWNMTAEDFLKDPECGLTLTWDVLKLGTSQIPLPMLLRLTLTWDVLKYWNWRLFKKGGMININMRCIEML